MKTVILAGGEGTRLRSVVSHVPKPMAAVGGRPFLEYVVRFFTAQGLNEFVMATGYMREKIRSHFSFGEALGCSISYSEETEPLGTGGAIRKAIEGLDDPSVLVINGDTFFDVDLTALIEHHRRNSAKATLALAHVSDSSRYGSVRLGGSGEVTGFEEKVAGRHGLINGGIHIVNTNVVRQFPGSSFSLEHEMLHGLVQNGLFGISFSGYFVDIGVPNVYLGLRDRPGLLERCIESKQVSTNERRKT